MFRLFLVFVFIALSASASPAFALDTGQCLPAAQVRAAVAAEGMNPIIVGNQRGYGRPYALIFMSNADGSNGYAIRADKPYGEQAVTACVESVFTDMRLNDPSMPGVPAWARMSVDPVIAAAICKKSKLGYQEDCSPYDQSLHNLDSHGHHVMMLATGTAINPRDKSVRTGQRLVLVINTNDARGLLIASTTEGAAYVLSAYTEGAFTQFAEK